MAHGVPLPAPEPAGEGMVLVPVLGSRTSVDVRRLGFPLLAREVVLVAAAAVRTTSIDVDDLQGDDQVGRNGIPDGIREDRIVVLRCDRMDHTLFLEESDFLESLRSGDHLESFQRETSTT